MRRVATAIGAAVLLMGSGVAFADPGGEKPNKPDKVKECNDRLDNDHDGNVDTADSDCGSSKDNSERPDDGDGDGGTTPAPDVQKAIEDFIAGLPAGPPGGGTPPALPAPLQDAVDTVVGSIPTDPSPGGAPPVPAGPEDVVGMIPAPAV